MNQFKYQAFLKEFYPLQEILLDGRRNAVRPASDCESIAVRRITPELLASVPEFDSYTGSMVDICRKESISFVLKDGTILQNCVCQAGTHGSNYAYEDTTIQEGKPSWRQFIAAVAPPCWRW